MRFAIFMGNRGFFPESLIASARAEVTSRLAELGIDSLCSPEFLTRYGAVETYAEGRAYAKFLEQHRGEYDGVILVMPNFSDENGASEGLRDCGVPIYLLAYPDELDKMDFNSRRDSFCGKFSIMDVFCQNRIPFTAWPPHTLSPMTATFAEHMRQFAAVCRIVKGMKRMRFGAFGARPTLFKTIRFDEVALQKYGITTEVYDNSDLLVRMRDIPSGSPELRDQMQDYRNYTDFSEVPDNSLEQIARMTLAIRKLLADYELDGFGLRCWSDLQLTAKISPCVILSYFNDHGVVASCELDIGNAIAMRALSLASQGAAACLDWNNNYADDPDKCILFHCGSTAQSLMAGKGKVVDHAMFKKSLGPGCSFGANTGFIKPMDFTFASCTTIDGQMRYYSGEGNFTADPLGEGFFGCGGCAHIPSLQNKLNAIGYAGYRHHVSASEGLWKQAIDEAFTRYLGYTQTAI